MVNEVATLPPGAHLSILRKFIERELGMRQRVLKGESRVTGVKDAGQALASLKALEDGYRARVQKEKNQCE